MTYTALVQPLSRWECPRCGKVLELASKRSLWSLLPFVCDHRAADMSGYYDLLRASGQTDVDQQIRDAGFEQREVYRRPISANEKGLSRKLRGRLRDELQERRRYWWLPLLSEERDQRKQFRKDLDEELALGKYDTFFAGCDKAMAYDPPKDNMAPWGPW